MSPRLHTVGDTKSNFFLKFLTEQEKILSKIYSARINNNKSSLLYNYNFSSSNFSCHEALKYMYLTFIKFGIIPYTNSDKLVYHNLIRGHQRETPRALNSTKFWQP